MIEIADYEFQEELVAAARLGGKIESDWSVSDQRRLNTAGHLERALSPLVRSNLLRLIPSVRISIPRSGSWLTRFNV
jgi:hypothetical protein